MAGSEAEQADLIEIGRIGKPHGVRGGFYLEGSIDAPALVAGLGLVVDGNDYAVATRGGTDGRPLITLTGISDREAIGRMRGMPVFARREDLTPLADGEWYAKDLMGLTVVSADGDRLGVVDRLVNAPSVDLLAVSPPEGEELLLPMVTDAIVSIDPAAGQVTVDVEFLDLG